MVRAGWHCINNSEGRTREILFATHLLICLVSLLTRGHFFIAFRGSDRVREFRERGREGQTEGEKHGLVAFQMHPDLGGICNLSTSPDQKSNWRPFGLWHDAQPTKPPRPGRSATLLMMLL